VRLKLEALRVRLNTPDDDHFIGSSSLAEFIKDVKCLSEDVILPEYRRHLRGVNRPTSTSEAKKLDKALFKALKDGNVSKAEQMLLQGADPSPSEPAPRPLTLDTSQKPPTGNTDWMEATTPPGTPPGDPDDSHEFVRGELVFADNAGEAFRQLPQAVSALHFGNLPARDMRRSLGDVDKWPGRESPSASGDAVMYSSNQLPQVNDNVTQEASQAPATRHDDMAAAVMDDLQHFTEERPSARGSIEATARSAYRDPTGHVVQPSNTTGQGGPPAQSFSADLFSSSQPSVTPSLQVDAPQGSDEDTVDI
jgi:hypothetical protein